MDAHWYSASGGILSYLTTVGRPLIYVEIFAPHFDFLTKELILLNTDAWQLILCTLIWVRLQMEVTQNHQAEEVCKQLTKEIQTLQELCNQKQAVKRKNDALLEKQIVTEQRQLYRRQREANISKNTYHQPAETPSNVMPVQRSTRPMARKQVANQSAAMQPTSTARTAHFGFSHDADQLTESDPEDLEAESDMVDLLQCVETAELLEGEDGTLLDSFANSGDALPTSGVHDRTTARLSQQNRHVSTTFNRSFSGRWAWSWNKAHPPPNLAPNFGS